MPEISYSAEGGVLGKYRELREIGSGGQAKVYRALDPELDRPVALKVLSPDLSASESFKQRFRDEMKTQARLNIPGIVKIFDCGEEGGLLYFAMELVEGAPIDKYADGQSLDLNKRVELVAKLSEITARIHKAGYGHLDLKPGNVLIDNEDEIKILDFGLSRAVANSGPDEKSQRPEVSGTPAYMSPEQTKGLGEAGMPSDIYSIGVISYELLTKHLPYELDFLSPEEAYMVIRMSPPELVKKYNPAIADKLEKIILSALEKSPSKRPAAAEFAKKLRLFLSEKSEAKPARIFALAAVAIICAGLIAYLLNLGGSAPSENPGKKPVEVTVAGLSNQSDRTDRSDQKSDASDKSDFSDKSGLPPDDAQKANPGNSKSANSAPLALYTSDYPEDLRKECLEKVKELRDSQSFSGKGALVYYLPDKTVMTLRDHGHILIRVDSRFQKGGTFYRSGGSAVGIEMSCDSEPESKVFEWTPQSGKVAVLK